MNSDELTMITFLTLFIANGLFVFDTIVHDGHFATFASGATHTVSIVWAIEIFTGVAEASSIGKEICSFPRGL